MAITNPSLKAAGDIGITATSGNISKLSDQIFGIFDNVAKRVWEQNANYQASQGKPIYVPPDVATSAGVSALSTGLIIGGAVMLGLAFILFNKGGGTRVIRTYARRSGARRSYRKSRR